MTLSRLINLNSNIYGSYYTQYIFQNCLDTLQATYGAVAEAATATATSPPVVVDDAVSIPYPVEE